MGSEKIQRIQRVSLILLDEFARVCRERGLRWFADSGTLLGAIRHGGFIPWDDDVDVVMPREDYNKLISISNEVFTPPFQLLHQSFCSAYNLSASLRYCDSAILNRNSLTAYYRNSDGVFLQNMGIGMDIEPLDHVPDDMYAIKDLTNIVKYFYESSAVDDLFGGPSKRSAIQHKRKRAVEVFDSTMIRVNAENAESGRVACTPWWMFYETEAYTVSDQCYLSYTEVAFNGCKEKVRIPVGYENILRRYYRDWEREEPRNTEGMFRMCIVDDKHSFRDYEKFSNEELKEMIDMGVSMN